MCVCVPCHLGVRGVCVVFCTIAWWSTDKPSKHLCKVRLMLPPWRWSGFFLLLFVFSLQPQCFVRLLWPQFTNGGGGRHTRRLRVTCDFCPPKEQRNTKYGSSTLWGKTVVWKYCWVVLPEKEAQDAACANSCSACCKSSNKGSENYSEQDF